MGWLRHSDEAGYCCAIKNNYLCYESRQPLTINTMEAIIAKIKEQIAAIEKDIDKIDNKAAKARVRKATLALEKLGKEYRKASI